MKGNAWTFGEPPTQATAISALNCRKTFITVLGYSLLPPHLFLKFFILFLCFLLADRVFVAVHRFPPAAASGVRSLVAERGLLIAAASLVAEHGVQSTWLQ